MLSSLRHRRQPRLLYALIAAISLALPSSALASGPPQPILKISRPHLSTVSGTILFMATGVGPGAGRVVFSIDGQRVWSTTRRPFRYRRSGVVNTRTLRDGRHVLVVEAFYRGQGARVARKTIKVRNRRFPGAHVSHGTALNVGVVGPSPAAGPPVANFNRETYVFSTAWAMSQEATRYQFIVLAGNQYALVPRLHALNPNLKILMYQSPLHTNANDYSYLRTVTGCTDYTNDITSHPNWILHDQYGNLVRSRGQTAEYLMDVGNPAYQQACAANAATVAKRYGFDGIFFDAVTGNVIASMNPGGTLPEYPTQASWVTAMTSMVSYLGPALRAQGLLTVGNIAYAPSAAVWEQWVSKLDGAEEESWTDGGVGLKQQVPWWSLKLAELAWTQANGKFELLHSYSSSETANAFGLAAMLLATSGRASYSTSNTNYGANEDWFPEYATAQALGAPAGGYRILANGIYERPFAHGIVLVNPTASSVPAFSLGGGAYTGSGATAVSSLAMRPTSGLILLRVG